MRGKIMAYGVMKVRDPNGKYGRKYNDNHQDLLSDVYVNGRRVKKVWKGSDIFFERLSFVYGADIIVENGTLGVINTRANEAGNNYNYFTNTNTRRSYAKQVRDDVVGVMFASTAVSLINSVTQHRFKINIPFRLYAFDDNSNLIIRNKSVGTDDIGDNLISEVRFRKEGDRLIITDIPTNIARQLYSENGGRFFHLFRPGSSIRVLFEGVNNNLDKNSIHDNIDYSTTSKDRIRGRSIGPRCVSRLTDFNHSTDTKTYQIVWALPARTADNYPMEKLPSGAVWDIATKTFRWNGISLNDRSIYVINEWRKTYYPGLQGNERFTYETLWQDNVITGHKRNYYPPQWREKLVRSEDRGGRWENSGGDQWWHFVYLDHFVDEETINGVATGRTRNPRSRERLVRHQRKADLYRATVRVGNRVVASKPFDQIYLYDAMGSSDRHHNIMRHVPYRVAVFTIDNSVDINSVTKIAVTASLRMSRPPISISHAGDIVYSNGQGGTLNSGWFDGINRNNNVTPEKANGYVTEKIFEQPIIFTKKGNIFESGIHNRFYDIYKPKASNRQQFMDWDGPKQMFAEFKGRDLHICYFGMDEDMSWPDKNHYAYNDPDCCYNQTIFVTGVQLFTGNQNNDTFSPPRFSVFQDKMIPSYSQGNFNWNTNRYS